MSTPRQERRGRTGRTFVGQGQGLRISASAGDLDHSVPEQHLHLLDRKRESRVRRGTEPV